MTSTMRDYTEPTSTPSTKSAGHVIVDSLAERCVSNVASLFRAKFAALWLVDDSGARLDLRRARGGGADDQGAHAGAVG